MKNEIGESNETLEAIRFLWAMVGVTADVLEVVDSQVGPAAEYLTCRNRSGGQLVSVCRSLPWSDEEERRYVDALDRALNADDLNGEQIVSVVSGSQLELVPR